MRKSILRTIEAVRPYIPRLQLMTMADGLRSEERGFFREKFRELVAVRGMNVDLHWKPCTLATIREGKARASAQKAPEKARKQPRRLVAA